MFDTGLRLPVAGPGLIGRGPESREPGVTCTAITDPDRSVSKVHLEYGRDEYGLWVKDRGSTNGSTLQHAGGVATPLVAGEATRLVTGDVVTFGHRSFRVEEV
ncbi:MAG: FHA domain-containing protein [Propionibacteriaceae bacterium]|nr:FHA domain-containing protein [Propionibacteriaceae bacterium]